MEKRHSKCTWWGEKLFSLTVPLLRSSTPPSSPQFLQLPGQDYEDRRTEITKYVHYTRRALVQLFVLLEWLSKQNDAMDTVMDGAIFLQSEAQQVCPTNEREIWFRCHSGQVGAF